MNRRVRKLKDMKHDDEPRNHECKAEKIPTHREVVVEGSVKVDLPQDLRTDYKSSQTDEKGYKKKTLFWARVSAILLAFYCSVTFALWYDAHNDFIIEHRAWISFEFTPPDLVENDPIRVVVRLKNIGKTQCKNIVYSMGIDLPKVADPVDIRYGGKLHTDGIHPILFPEGGTNVPDSYYIAGGGIKTFTAEQIRELRSGDRYIAIYGIGTYIDIFDKAHWFRFCDVHFYMGRSSNTGSCVMYNSMGDGAPPEDVKQN
jgi:hypothetical protein